MTEQLCIALFAVSATLSLSSHCLSKRSNHSSPFMNKNSSYPILPHPATILTRCLPLSAQAALHSTWIILVLRRRSADPTAAAAAAVATVLLQVSVWNCRNVDFIVIHSRFMVKETAIRKNKSSKPVYSTVARFSSCCGCVSPLDAHWVLCVCYAHSHEKELTVSCTSWPSANWKPPLEVATWKTPWIALCPLQRKPALQSGQLSCTFAYFNSFLILFKHSLN